MNFPRSLLKDSALINGTRNGSSEIVLGNDIIYIPFIISIVGMIGNFMTIVTILKTDMRKNYANHYILVLLTSDTILLLNLFIRFWVEIDTISFNLCVSARYIWCVAVYVSNFAIISLTMERFFAIVFPLHHMKNSHLNRWKIILAWLIPTLLLSFNVLYALKGTTEDDVAIKFSSTKSERIKCTFDYERPHVDIIFHIPRLIFSFILTLIVVISVNLIITGKLKARSVFRSRSTSYQSQRAPRRKAFFKGESSSKETQATSIILAVIPILYVFLNTPFWLRQFLKFFMKNKENLQFINKHYFFTTISYYMFCINFAINFIVYALISPNFRISFFKVWFCRNDPRLSSSVRFSANATAISRIVSSGSSVSDNNAAVVIEEASITSGRNSIKEA